MTVKSGQAWSGLIVTKDATGALATPSTGPAGVLYVDGTANAAVVTLSGTNPYKWAVTLPSLTAGQCVSMYITATIGAISTASVVAEDVGDITVSAVVAISATQAEAVAAGSLALASYYTFAQAITSTSILDLSTAELILGIKQSVSDTDANALLLLSKSAGLTVLAQGAYTTPAHGTLTVGGSAGAWTITAEVSAAAMGALDAYAGAWLAELKAQVGGDDWPIWSGAAIISRSIVRDTA